MHKLIRKLIKYSILALPIFIAALTSSWLPGKDNSRFLFFSVFVLPLVICMTTCLKAVICWPVSFSKLGLTFLLSVLVGALAFVPVFILGMFAQICWLGCPSGFKENLAMVPVVYFVYGFITNTPLIFINMRKPLKEEKAEIGAEDEKA